MTEEFSEYYINIGLKVSYFRKKAGMTQEMLAERIGKSVNFIGQVEGTGTIRGVSLETLFKIAQVLHIPPSVDPMSYLYMQSSVSSSPGIP